MLWTSHRARPLSSTTRRPPMHDNTVSPISVYAAIELSKTTWLVALLSPDSNRVRLRQVRGGDAVGLVTLLENARMSAERSAGALPGIVVCFEAGYDGFWLARFLQKHGIRTSVLDSTSFL